MQDSNGSVDEGLTPASATIDSGRLLTLERRRKFSGLKLTVVSQHSPQWFTIDCRTRPESAGVLSERRIARELRTFGGIFDFDFAVARYAARIAIWVQLSMRDWANDGYRTGVVGAVSEKRFPGPDIRAYLNYKEN